jgi:hypothetical protein
MLEEIENAASQVVGSNLEAANASGIGLADHPQPTHQQIYNQEMPSPRYNQPPHINQDTHGARPARPSPAFVNAYQGALPSHSQNLAAGMPQMTTPSSQRHRYAGPGLSAVQGVVAGTPRGTPKGAVAPRVNLSGSGSIRQPYLDPGQVPKPSTRFTGVTLGAGVPRGHDMPQQGPSGLGASRYAVGGHGSGGYERGTLHAQSNKK